MLCVPEEPDGSFLHPAVAGLSAARGCESQTCPRGMEQLPTTGPKGGQHWQQGKDRCSLTLPWTHRVLKKNTARGLFLIAVSRWYMDEPGSGNITEIKYKNPPLEPGVTKPQLGTARLFLWFDAPRCPAGPPHLCPAPGVAPGRPQLAHAAPRPSPLAGWASQRHGLFWGGNRDAGGKSMGKALRAGCPVAGVKGHRLVRCELGEGDMF